MIHRREFLAAMPAALGLAAQSAARKPNVLLIMSDDQGFGDLSLHDNPYLKTPAMDRIAAQGTEFRRFYVSPVCAPTRASLLTGRYHLRGGVYGVTAGQETLRTNETTLAESLRPAGYRTALVGKWHLGEHYPYVPHAQGFDEFTGFRTGHWTTYFDPPLERNGKSYQAKGYIADVFTDEGIRFMERNRQNPFFLYMAYNTPHTPYQVPDSFYEPYKNNKLLPKETAIIYSMVKNLDGNIARLLGRLDELKLANDTIVIFLSDNGPNGRRYNVGLRAAKGSVYEGGTRVPFFIRWPGHIEAGKKIDTIAAHIDVYPTVLDLCGVKTEQPLPLDGRSIAPLLRNQAANWPDRMLFTYQHGRAGKGQGAVRTQRFNLINKTELYEIPVDPGEQDDVAAKFPGQAAALAKAYTEWFDKAGKECRFEHLPIPIGYWEENPATLTPPQCEMEGTVRFYGGSGWAHDWVTNWTATTDAVHWDIDVHEQARFRVRLRYLCAKENVGVKVKVEAAGASVESFITEPTPMTPRPARDIGPLKEAPEMFWGEALIGTFSLPKGNARLTVRAISIPGNMAMDLKAVILERISQ